MSTQDSLTLLSNLQTAISDVVAAYNGAYSLNSQLQSQIQNLQSQISSLNANSADLNSKLAAAAAQIADLTKQLSAPNIYAPTVNPAVSMKTLGCRVHAHIVCWFGQSNHTDVGYSSQSDDTIAWQTDQMIAKGISGVNVLFSGRANTFNTAAAQKVIAAAQARGLIVSLMIDHEDKVTADDFKWAQDNLMAGPTVWKWNGKRVLFVFDDPTTDQLAAIESDVVLVYRNAGGLSKPQSSGCYGWPSPGAEDTYCSYFYSKVTGVTNKLVVPHVSPGFLGASWNQSSTFKPTPWLYGQEWINSINRVLKSGLKPTDVMIATWNDHEEGTGIERSPLL